MTNVQLKSLQDELDREDIDTQSIPKTPKGSADIGITFGAGKVAGLDLKNGINPQNILHKVLGYASEKLGRYGNPLADYASKAIGSFRTNLYRKGANEGNPKYLGFMEEIGRYLHDGDINDATIEYVDASYLQSIGGWAEWKITPEGNKIIKLVKPDQIEQIVGEKAYNSLKAKISARNPSLSPAEIDTQARMATIGYMLAHERQEMKYKADNETWEEPEFEAYLLSAFESHAKSGNSNAAAICEAALTYHDMRLSRNDKFSHAVNRIYDLSEGLTNGIKELYKSAGSALIGGQLKRRLATA